ncbi:MAG: hypothetical protein FWE63_00230 [Bacteroidales bacterium]|nr:hypothetical protein [Bacteroidales bacterium]
MKKILTIIAVLFTISLTIHAACPGAAKEHQCSKSEFVVIEFADLDEVVQVAITDECEKNGHKVDRVARHKEKGCLTVVAVCEEGNEIVYLFDADGKRKENKE